MNQKDFRTRVPLSSEKVHLILLASASAQSFAEVFWETVQGDSEIAILMLNILSRLQERKQYDQMFEVLRILHSAFRVRFGRELLALQDDSAAPARRTAQVVSPAGSRAVSHPCSELSATARHRWGYPPGVHRSRRPL